MFQGSLKRKENFSVGVGVGGGKKVRTNQTSRPKKTVAKQVSSKQREEEPSNVISPQSSIDTDNPLIDPIFSFSCEVIEAGKIEPLALDQLLDPVKLMEWIIAPMAIQDFLDNIWEKKCLHIKRGALAFESYEALFPKVEMQRIINEDELQYGVDLNVTSYKNGAKVVHDKEGKVTMQEIKKAFNKGCSIRLLRPQKYSKVVWNVLSTLEDFFQCMVGANCYWTPANTQGFAPHFDDIEAFLIQTDGSKLWKLYEPQDPSSVLALESSPNFDQADLKAPFYQAVVEKGDLLYFPRYNDFFCLICITEA